LPPEFTRPLPQLISVLARHDYAPFNAGQWVGVHGTLSMVPVAIAALALLYSGYRRIAGWQQAALVLVGSLVTGTALLVPLVLRPDEDPGLRGSQAFVTRRWTPEGHDVAARIEQRLIIAERSGDPQGARMAAYRELAETYREEGRDNEASRTDRRLDRNARGLSSAPDHRQ
jgi:hypothetical protein